MSKYAKSISDVLLLSVLNYTKQDAILFSKPELEAGKQGSPMRRTDAMIAAIYVNNDAMLCTFETKHFRPISKQDLKLFT